MIDPIADMLTRIRNSLAVKKPELVLPMSKMKLALAKILESDGWIERAEEKKESGEKFGELRIVLKYKNGKPCITNLKRISKPSLRIYAKKDRLPRVLNGLGMAVISTPAGLMTNKEARKKGLGGEVVCEIY